MSIVKKKKKLQVTSIHSSKCCLTLEKNIYHKGVHVEFIKLNLNTVHAPFLTQEKSSKTEFDD